MARIAWAVLCFNTLSLVAFGADGETDAVVVARDVVVYAAPQSNSPDTATLPKGTRVRVHHEEAGGWLAIQPPNGSISWVNHRFLEFAEGSLSSATVVCGEAGVEIEAGKYGVNSPLGVRRTKLAKDTAVTVMAPKTRWDTDGSTWYPIWSPHGDFRYIRKEFVQLAAGAAPDIVRVAGTVPLTETAGAFVSVKPAFSSNHPLWVQAETAEKTGEWDKAERAYFQLAGEMNKVGGDPDVANSCYARIHALREKRRETTPKTNVGTLSPATTFEEAAKLKQASANTNSPAIRDAKEYWYGPGELSKAVGQYQGNPIFALESEPGRVIVYAVAAPGVDLTKLLRRNVTVSARVLETDYSQGKAMVEVTSVVSR
jgi:hypothetical protein